MSVMKARNKTLESVQHMHLNTLYSICPSTTQALDIIHCSAKGQSLLFTEGNPFKINFQCILLNILKKTSYGPVFR